MGWWASEQNVGWVHAVQTKKRSRGGNHDIFWISWREKTWNTFWIYLVGEWEKNIFRTSWCHGLKRVSGRCCNLAASVSNLSTANWALSLETWNYCVFNSFAKLILESWSLWDLFSKSARQCSRNLLSLRTFESIVPFNQRQKKVQKMYWC